MSNPIRDAIAAQEARDAADPIDRTSILTELAGIARRPLEDLCRPQSASEERRVIPVILDRLTAWVDAEITMVEPSTDPHADLRVQAVRVRELAQGLRDFASILRPTNPEALEAAFRAGFAQGRKLREAEVPLK